MSYFGQIDYDLEVARGNREPDVYGFSKFGYNSVLNIADGERVIWSYTAANWAAMTAAETLDISSTSGNDVLAGTGARGVTITGLDASGDYQQETVAQSGTWRSVNTWTAVNRVEVSAVGTTGYNEGDIRVFGTGSGSTQGWIPTGAGTTQQLFFTPRTGYSVYIESVYLRSIKTSGGANPKATINLYVVNSSGVRINKMKQIVDVSVRPILNIEFKNTIKVPDGGHWYLTASTDSNNTFIFAMVEQKEAQD